MTQYSTVFDSASIIAGIKKSAGTVRFHALFEREGDLLDFTEDDAGVLPT